ncbi:hypothetical protein [Streptomyces sp. AGS-58]|uniref:hypothetical protein n=1 Tax=unclassified Streptomyces TaxID=2593676 RepID=UPI0035A30B7C
MRLDRLAADCQVPGDRLVGERIPEAARIPSTHIADRGDGARQYRSGSGDIHARESSHWDVPYHDCGGC